MNLKREKFKQIFFNCINKGAVFIVTVVSIYELITGFFYKLIERLTFISDKNSINSIMYIVLFIGLVYIFIYSIYEVFRKQVVINIKADDNPKIIIKLDSYENNMESVINNLKDSNDNAIFVIGINDEIDASKAQRRGVHKAVIDKFYNTQERFELLHKRTQKAFESIINTEDKYGEIGLVEHDENSKIMFVINSKNGSEKSHSIIGPQPTEIIKNIFNCLESYDVNVVQMPILSSKNVLSIDNDKIRFSIIIVEIIEEYFKQVLNNKNKNYDLILSIREEDLKVNSITLGNIVKFIEELKPMYHIQ